MATAPRTIKVLPRQEVLDFLKSLGHDPNEVARIVVTPFEVEVVYVHPISDRRED
jgi:hypothetical protein